MKASTYLRKEMCPSQRGLRKVIGEKTQAIPVLPSSIRSCHWDPASQKAKAQPGCLRKTVLRQRDCFDMCLQQLETQELG